MVLKTEMHIAEELYFQCKREEKQRQEAQVKMKKETYQATVMVKQEIESDDDEWEDIEVGDNEWETFESISELSFLKGEYLLKDETKFCNSKQLSPKDEDYAWNNKETSLCFDSFQQYQCDECPMEFSNKSDIAEHYEFNLHIPNYSPMTTKFALGDTTFENNIDSNLDSEKSLNFRYIHYEISLDFNEILTT